MEELHKVSELFKSFLGNGYSGDNVSTPWKQRKGALTPVQKSFAVALREAPKSYVKVLKGS